MTMTVISIAMRARDNMIMQGIKRWLHNLFAWWPWKTSSETDYAQTVSTPNKSNTQEALFFTAVDGSYAQPAQSGVTSVAVEPLEESVLPEGVRPVSDERSPAQASVGESENIPFLEEKGKVGREGDGVVQSIIAPAVPTPEQRLEFLRYLVERGIVNEGNTKER